MRHGQWLLVVLLGCLCAAAWGQTQSQNPTSTPAKPAGQAQGAGGAPPSNPAAGATNAPKPPEPKLEGVYPSTVYPNKDGSYDFELVGKNLPTDLSHNPIQVSGEGPILFETDPSKCKTDLGKSEVTKPCLQEVIAEKVLSVKGFRLGATIPATKDKNAPEEFQPGRNQGFRAVSLTFQLGEEDKTPVNLTLAKFTKSGVQAISVLVFGILLLIVLLVIKRISTYKIDGKKYSPLTAFLLDRQTNSYSLSKFQLVFWTAIFVFGYVYLFVCQTLVQGTMSWPAIPDNLPQLFAFSAGTTVAATGITLSRGSKGAGPIEPSVADFISTGGLVVGDRFQFFVWTLVGGFAFLSLLFQTDPSALNQLPAVPQGFLYLMGVSSVGYLGGKVVRKPGPVIKAVSVVKVVEADDVGNDPRGYLRQNYGLPDSVTDPTIPALILKLEGENLDAKAVIKIGDQAIEAYRFWIKPGQRQDQSDFFTELYVNLANAEAFLAGQHTLTLINTDGQAAAVCFPKDPMTIESVNPSSIVPGAAPAVLTIKGQNFAEGTRAEWRGAPVPQANITRDSDTQLRVSIVPGDLPQGATPGTGTLTLKSPANLRAKTDITIKPAQA